MFFLNKLLYLGGLVGRSGQGHGVIIAETGVVAVEGSAQGPVRAGQIAETPLLHAQSVNSTQDWQLTLTAQSSGKRPGIKEQAEEQRST